MNLNTLTIINAYRQFSIILPMWIVHLSKMRYAKYKITEYIKFQRIPIDSDSADFIIAELWWNLIRQLDTWITIRNICIYTENHFSEKGICKKCTRIRFMLQSNRVRHFVQRERWSSGLSTVSVWGLWPNRCPNQKKRGMIRDRSVKYEMDKLVL